MTERKTMQVSVRMTKQDIAPVDEWRKDVEDLPSRPEAIRRLLRQCFLYKTMIESARKRGLDV